MADDASQYEDLGPIEGGTEDLGAVKASAKPTEPTYQREPSVGEDILSLFPSLGKVGAFFGKAAQKLDAVPHPVAAYEATKNRSDPLLSRVAGVSAAGMELLKPFTAPLGVLDRAAKAGAYDISLGGTTNKERLSEYLTGGQPLSESMDVALPDTSSATVNFGTGMFNSMANAPVTTLASFAAGPIVEGATKSVLAGRLTPEQATQLLQSRLKPSPNSEMGQNFRQVGSNALRLIGKEKAATVSDIPSAIDATAKAKESVMQPVWDQVMRAKLLGEKVQGDAIAQNLDRLADSSYFKNHAPESLDAITEKADFYRGKQFNVEDAIHDLSDFNEQMRSLDQKVGAPEDVAKSKLQYKVIEQIRNGLRDQLNEVVSPEGQPNMFKEAYRDFSDLSDVEHLLRRADTAEQNQLVPGLNIPTSRRGVIDWVLNKTPSKDVAKAVKVARKGNFPEPTPMAPQKPSLLPESTPAPAPAISQGFSPPQVSVGPEVPTWITDIQRAARDPVDQFKDIQDIRKIVEGKSKISPAEYLKDPEASAWGKNLVKRLSEDPANAKAYLDQLEAEVGQKVNPFKYGGAVPYEGYTAIVQEAPISSESSRISGVQKQPATAPTSVPRPEPKLSSDFGSASKTRIKIARGMNEPVDVKFSHPDDKIAMSLGKSLKQKMLGQERGEVFDQEGLSVAISKKYGLSQHEAWKAARDYNDYVRGLANQVDPNTSGQEITPISFAEFLKQR